MIVLPVERMSNINADVCGMSRWVHAFHRGGEGFPWIPPWANLPRRPYLVGG